ncbi:MAG TPA: hypothetical protein ENG51_13615 [Deltaproteobacteria bacterium]|nr:hypothetical protein [Deltaproteobacteria bacterium]
MAQYYYSDRQVKTEDIVDSAVTPAKLSFGTWEKIAEVNVTSQVAQVDITNLPAEDKVLMLVLNAINTGSLTSCAWFIRFNNDTGTNYENTAYVLFYNPNKSAFEELQRHDDAADRACIAETYIPMTHVSHSIIYDLSSEEKTISSYGGTGTIVTIAVGEWKNTTDNITSISIFGPSGLYFAPGSKIIVFRLSK